MSPFQRTLLPRAAMFCGLVLMLACGGGDTQQTAPVPPTPVDHGKLDFLAGNLDGWGYVDGTQAQARFAKPMGIARDGQGNFYIADTYNHTIRKVTAAGQVTTLAGSPGQRGSTDGTGAAARFNTPKGLAVDASGNVFVADYANQLIRKITPAGVVTTYTGQVGVMGSTNGTLAQAQFASPFGLVFDSTGNLFVSDLDNGTIRKITSAGQVSTLAGTPLQFGAADGQGAAAMFSGVYFLTVDAQNNIYVADGGNHAIRKITQDGTVTTFAGTLGSSGYLDSSDKLTALFNEPYSVAFDTSGAVLVGDTYNHRIRKIHTTGEVTTLSGSAAGFLGGYADGAGATAKFSYPSGILTDLAGGLYVTDQWNNAVRKVVVSTGATSTWAGAVAQSGTADGLGAAARFGSPYTMIATGTGDLLVADMAYHTIRKITTTGDVTTYAGMPAQPGSANGSLGTNTFKNPYGLTMDAAGNAFVADWGNHIIRKISPVGLASTYSGTASTTGGTTDAPPAYNFPRGVAVDAAGNVWVADTGSHTIRRIEPNGTVTTVAGSPGVSGFVNGTGAAARFATPNDVAVDGSGRILVADAGNTAIRVVDPGTGAVTTLAGDKETINGSPAPAKDGLGAAARFSYPRALCIDKAAGVVYVADQDAHAIRRVNLSTGDVKTVVGTLNLSGVKLGELPGGLYFPRGVVFLNGKLYLSTAKGLVVATPPPAGF